MKKKIITLFVLAVIGLALFFVYENLFSKSCCKSACENKDSIAITTPIVKDSVHASSAISSVTSTVAETPTLSTVVTTVTTKK